MDVLFACVLNVGVNTHMVPQTDLSVGVLTVLVKGALVAVVLRRQLLASILACNLQYLVI